MFRGLSVHSVPAKMSSLIETGGDNGVGALLCSLRPLILSSAPNHRVGTKLRVIVSGDLFFFFSFSVWPGGEVKGGGEGEGEDGGGSWRRGEGWG